MAHFTSSPLFQLVECSSSLNVISPTFSGDISNSPTWISIQFPEGFLLKFSLRVRVFECERMMVRVTESFQLLLYHLSLRQTQLHTEFVVRDSLSESSPEYLTNIHILAQPLHYLHHCKTKIQIVINWIKSPQCPTKKKKKNGVRTTNIPKNLLGIYIWFVSSWSK